jgi:pilus assembly protein FimV
MLKFWIHPRIITDGAMCVCGSWRRPFHQFDGLQQRFVTGIERESAEIPDAVTMTLRQQIGWAALALVGLGLDANALTLGRVRGAALVGQPLETAISVELGQGEFATALCPEAEVFYADTRVSQDRVRVAVTAGAGQSAVVRVSSAMPVDEPVVTVYVRVGCEQRSTRRYVLLADVPSEQASSNLPNVAPISPEAAVAATVQAASAPAPTGASVGAAPVGGSTAGSAPSLAEANPAVGRPRSATGATPAQPVAPKRLPAKKQVLVREPKAVEAPKPPAAKAVAPAVVDTTKNEVPPAPKDATKEAVKEPAQATAKDSAKDAPASKADVATLRKQEKLAAGEKAGQSRLKLDPLLTLTERIAALEVASTTPSPEQVKEAQRVQSLEESVKALVTLAQKNEASMLEMRTRLAKAEEERVSMQWIYLLGAALLAALGAIAYLFVRGNRVAARQASGEWWAGDAAGVRPGTTSSSEAMGDASVGSSTSRRMPVAPVVGAAGDSPLHQDSEAKPSNFSHSVIDELHEARTSQFNSKTDARAKSAVVQARAHDDEVDVSLVEMSESNFDQLMQSGQAHGAVRRGPLSPQQDAMATRVQAMELARPVNSDQIEDVRQQAAFFGSLGQHDQAVRVLEEAMARSAASSSPHFHLDLMAILHSQGLKQDYERVRGDFNLLFNSEAPTFDAYGQEGRALADYPHVLAHIGTLWNTPKVQAVIEASVLRDPADVQGKPFDLAAFRELLLLHAVAQTAQKGGPVSGIMPLGGTGGTTNQAATINVRPHAAAEAAGGVDIALDSQQGLLPVRVQTLGKSAGSTGQAAATGADVDLDLDLSDVMMPELPAVTTPVKSPVPALASKKASAPAFEIEPQGGPTDLPTLAPEFGLPVSPEVAKQGLVDNNFLDFETDKTVKYTLPKKG